jgi:hypothetical protein
MVTMSALHALTAELHSGMLSLAFACIMIVFAAQVVVRLKNRMPGRFVHWAIVVRGYAEPAGYVAAVAGLLGLLLSAWTGMYAWPMEKLLDSGIVRNKILFTVYATALWTIVVFMRTRFGRGLWSCPPMMTVYAGTAFVAYGFIGMAGSLGAHITQGGSVLDPLWNIVGFRVSSTVELAPQLAAAIALASALVFVITLRIASKYDLFSMKLAPETCQKIFKWDEPKMQEPTSGAKS